MSEGDSYSVSVFSQPSLSNLHLLRPEANPSDEDDGYIPSKRSKSSKDDLPHAEVMERFRSGCECSPGPSDNCFSDLDPAAIHHHRLNIMDLSKAEQDMYFMGLLHASLQNPDITNRKKERQRLKSKYQFFGKDVCLDAFLYIQNTSRHQLKSLRKHLMTSGVQPRVHGNAGKKPHNTFSASNYQDVHHFLSVYLESHRLSPSSSPDIILPSEFNAKKIHAVYMDNFSSSDQDHKIMSYTTFRRFLHEQFPSLKYEKGEDKTAGHIVNRFSESNE